MLYSLRRLFLLKTLCSARRIIKHTAAHANLYGKLRPASTGVMWTPTVQLLSKAHISNTARTPWKVLVHRFQPSEPFWHRPFYISLSLSPFTISTSSWIGSQTTALSSVTSLSYSVAAAMTSSSATWSTEDISSDASNSANDHFLYPPTYPPINISTVIAAMINLF